MKTVEVIKTGREQTTIKGSVMTRKTQVSKKTVSLPIMDDSELYGLPTMQSSSTSSATEGNQDKSIAEVVRVP